MFDLDKLNVKNVFICSAVAGSGLTLGSKITGWLCSRAAAIVVNRKKEEEETAKKGKKAA